MLDALAILIDIYFRSLIWFFLPQRRSQEILLLRKELQVLKRQIKKPKFTNMDRLFLTALYRTNNSIIDKITIIKPDTVIAWHRKLVAWKWTYSKKLGRPKTSRDMTSLVIEMKKNNPRWGARKIKGELRKLGVNISKTTVLAILKDAGFSPGKYRLEQTWFQFLRSHSSRYLACDFLVVDTAFLKRLYVFALMDVSTREILTTAVTANPTAFWLADFLKDCYDTRLYRTPPRCPNCNSFIERWNRTIRDELIDHQIFWGEVDLRASVKVFRTYFNNDRPHQSLGLNWPLKNHGENTVFKMTKVHRKRVLGGLIVNYELAA